MSLLDSVFGHHQPENPGTNALIVSTGSLSCVPDQDPGPHRIIQVITNLPAGQKNAFYIDAQDLDGIPILLPIANQAVDAPINSDAMNQNDAICFDIQDGIHHLVIWNGHRIRQRDYSFDWVSNPNRPEDFER